MCGVWLRRQIIAGSTLAVRIVIALGIIVGGYTTYAYMILPHVSAGDMLTSTTWNNMIDTINQHSTDIATLSGSMQSSPVQCNYVMANGALG